MNQIDYFKSRVQSTFSPMDYMMSIQANPDAYLLIDVRNGDPSLKLLSGTEVVTKIQKQMDYPYYKAGSIS
ncbi:hypothetical protein CVD25_02235 [Bacillus canaveralius]|uniref:Uncharacterized protein n=1 Tax=Bacillus canaveralius TaxID=1403243 RepID=A0A2N5GPA7_9BACI|nr:hypothetical protein [Bacillus canaveralius]PLR84409.1 hypothetical protein CU635_06560 [Bacillus canaveralius]PLS00589.1 hypothetical protein CVD25_02235 [Bacillus canaveralius]RSK57874.1 hypothetical protein EJA13_00445 [Bacillus canaveralius]